MKKIISLVALSIIFASCEKEDDQDGIVKIDRTEIKDFIWKGMNKYYLWQEEIPDLADDRFAPSVEQTTLANPQYADYLAIRTAKNLFNELIEHGRDYYSSITTDYTRWEQSFQGIAYSSGMEYLIFRHINREYYGVVTYVLPSSGAFNAGIQRGHLFSKVNGERLTATNQAQLLSNENTSMTIDEVQVSNVGGVEYLNSVRENITINKSQLTENPIQVEKVLTIGTKTIGYLMYNSFISNFDVQLNEAFGRFQAAGVNELILDLRYNTGGSVPSAIRLSSMITGQFTGDLFSKEIWNRKIEPEVVRTKGIENLFLDKFKDENGTEHPINSLGLNRLYVLTSSRTASASELVINSLTPYIGVVQIGAKTLGKNQAAIEVYDEDENGVRNPRHKWAMLPMAVKHENKDGFSDFHEGLEPAEEYEEDFFNMGQLGEMSDPMFAKAIDMITTSPMRIGIQPRRTTQNKFEIISISGENNIAKNRMIQKVK